MTCVRKFIFIKISLAYTSILMYHIKKTRTNFDKKNNTLHIISKKSFVLRSKKKKVGEQKRQE